MKGIRRFSAILLGSVFFIAGILKLMDPLGTSLIVESYLKFLHIGFLRPASYVIGEGLALLETMTGACVITGVWKKVMSIVCGLMLAFFTLLVLALIVFDADMDCGCFGEAIHLTNTQSLIKNIVLIALWIPAYVPRNYEPPRKAKYVAIGITGLSVLAFMVFFIANLPAKDFTAFAPGTELMGSDSQFSEDDPVLTFSDENGQYADSLALGGRVMIFSVYDPDGLSQADSDKVEDLFNRCSLEGILPLALFASTPEETPGVYYADRKELMTLNRANAGATFICDGQIVAKWNPSHFPDETQLKELAVKDPTESLIAENTSQKLGLQAFLLYVFAVMLLL